MGHPELCKHPIQRVPKKCMFFSGKSLKFAIHVRIKCFFSHLKTIPRSKLPDQTRGLPISITKTTWGLVGTCGTKHACILRNEFLMYRDFTITICLEPTQRLVIAGAFVRAFWKLELFTFAPDILTLIKMMYAHISRKGHHILISYTIENTFNWRR